MPPLVHALDGHVSPGLCVGLLPPGGDLRALLGCAPGDSVSRRAGRSYYAGLNPAITK